MECLRVDLHLPEGLRNAILIHSPWSDMQFRTFPICNSFLAPLNLGRARVDSR